MLDSCISPPLATSYSAIRITLALDLDLNIQSKDDFAEAAIVPVLGERELDTAAASSLHLMYIFFCRKISLLPS